jgi:peptide deformylase
LRDKCLEVDFTKDLTLHKIVEEMQYAMDKANGVGLAAPQVGIQLQLFIIDPNKALKHDLPRVYINPKISFGGKKIAGVEGCLSIPGRVFVVHRRENVTMTALDIWGKEFAVKCEDWSARVIQHEFDHISGLLIDMKGKEFA